MDEIVKIEIDIAYYEGLDAITFMGKLTLIAWVSELKARLINLKGNV